MEVNFERVIDESIERGVQMAHLSSLGYVVNNDDICMYYCCIVLQHMQSVYEDLSKEQKENVNEMYFKLVCL